LPAPAASRLVLAEDLRFGAATTPQQRQTYRQLFGNLEQRRDEVLAEARLESTAPARADSPVEWIVEMPRER